MPRVRRFILGVAIVAALFTLWQAWIALLEYVASRTFGH